MRKKVEDGSKFCAYCGEQFSLNIKEKEKENDFCESYEEKSKNEVTASDTSTQQAHALKKKLSKKIVFPIIGLVAVVLVAFIISGNSYKSVVKNFFSAIENNDAKQLLDTISESWKEYGRDMCTEEELEEYAKDFIESFYDEADCGRKIKIKYEITNIYRPTKEEIKELEDFIYEGFAFEVYDRDDFKVTDAKVLEFAIHVEGENRVDTLYYPDGMLVFKENGKWKIILSGIRTSWYYK